MSLAEAKERLRSASIDAGARSWVKKHPLESALAVFLAGFLTGSTRQPRELLRDAALLLLKL